MELLEDCKLIELNTKILQQLFLQDIHITNWGRRLAEQELNKTEERLILRQFRTALERYRQLLQHPPESIPRVQVNHIASCLGISRVKLSRILAEIR